MVIPDIPSNESYLIASIKEIILTSRKNIVRSVNTEMLSVYWNIGKLIVEDEQKNQERAQYGDETLKLSPNGLKQSLEMVSLFQISNSCAVCFSLIQINRHCLLN